MSKLERMTPKEAKEYLLKLDRRAKERQAAYLERKAAAGMRRVNTYVSAETGAALDALMAESGRNVGETIGAALISAARHLDRPTSRPAMSSRKTPPEIEQRILELSNTGMGPQAIANRLNEDGISSPTGGQWERGPIGKIVKRMRVG